MKLVALDIPDDSAALAGWLEGHLTGLDLGLLVAELDAVHGSSAGTADTLDDLLGNRRELVLNEGLGALPREDLRRLLVQPRLLLDLQELVLIEGGSHWQRLAANAPGMHERTERVRARLEPVLQGARRAEDERDQENAVLHIPRRWHRSPWLGLLAMAAVVLVMVVIWYERPHGPAPIAGAGWGWSRPDALPQDLPRNAYLERLADDAEEWFKKRPDEAETLSKRIAEFRQGCSVLIEADHKPLSAKDRQWLVSKCQEWAAKLDAHLAAVRAGDDPLKVRDATDGTVRKLINALRDRAKATA